MNDNEKIETIRKYNQYIGIAIDGLLKAKEAIENPDYANADVEKVKSLSKNSDILTEELANMRNAKNKLVESLIQ